MLDSFLFGGHAGDRTFDGVSETFATATSASARTEAGQSNRKAQDALDRVERLSLVCMAMWSLVQERTDLTEDDLLARVELLDLLDGEADGKSTARVQPCSKCDRPVGKRHKRCIYCGTPRPDGSVFDAR